MSDINKKLWEFNKEVEGKRIAIMGVGISNFPLIDYFYNLDCDVAIFDAKEKEDVDKSIIEKCDKLKIKYFLGKDYLKDLVGFDYIFRGFITNYDRYNNSYNNPRSERRNKWNGRKF